MTTQHPIALADIYMRLSSEEAGDKAESSSITNQRNIIHQYCERNNIGIVKEFVDDGYSGSNFNRPGFMTMLDHLQTGAANMVITKDLSRLGRDMTESSHYAERVFPNMGLRYIAISDSFDSEEINPMAPFYFAMNDVYLRDISRKIKMVLQSKRQRGEYCAAAPFGYMKNPDDKSKLIPNPETAPIVQRVFKMALSGMTCRKIATILTDECVVTPSRYRANNSANYTDRGLQQVVDHWCHTTVKRMLQNEVYLGKTQLGKTKRPSLKSNRKVIIPKNDWIQFENTHTPLISQHSFNLVQNYLKIHAKNWRDGDQVRRSIFNGVAFCQSCGSAMCSAGTTYKGEKMKYWFLYCNAPTRSSEKQCNHRARIRYRDLVQIITAELQSLTNLTDLQKQELINRLCEQQKQQSLYRDNRTPAELEARIAAVQKALSKSYIDNASGLLNDAVFAATVKQLTSDLQTAQDDLARVKSMVHDNDSYRKRCEQFMELLDRYAPITELDTEIVHTFIERIEIGEQVLPDGYKQRTNHSIPVQQSITIRYKFIGCMQNLEQKEIVNKQ